MSTAEAIHNPRPHFPALPDTVGFARRFTQSLSLSHHDQTHAAQAIAESTKYVGELVGIQTDIIEATEAIPIDRVQRIATIRHSITGHNHQVLHTEPHDPSRKIATASVYIPGITQSPTSGNGNLSYTAYADANPFGDNLAIHTDGVGEYDKLGFWQALRRPFDGMAQSRLDIIKAVCGEASVGVNAQSMGTAIVVKMANLNLDAPQDRQIHIDNVVLVSPAIVTPDQVLKVMGREFPAYAIAAEMGEAEVSRLRAAAFVLSRMYDLRTPYVGNARELLHGTEKSDFMKVAANNRLGIIHGDEPLAQTHLYDEAKASYPDNVHVLHKAGRAHSVDTPEYAREIAEDARDLRCLGRFVTAASAHPDFTLAA